MPSNTNRFPITVNCQNSCLKLSRYIFIVWIMLFERKFFNFSWLHLLFVGSYCWISCIYLMCLKIIGFEDQLIVNSSLYIFKDYNKIIYSNDRNRWLVVIDLIDSVHFFIVSILLCCAVFRPISYFYHRFWTIIPSKSWCKCHVFCEISSICMHFPALWVLQNPNFSPM